MRLRLLVWLPATYIYQNDTFENPMRLTNWHQILHTYYFGSLTDCKSIRIEAAGNSY